MSRIRGTDTQPEQIVRKFLFSKGLRYRKNVASLPGKPDIVLPKYKTVIFVHGCFWHHHDCGRFVWPKSNPDYWRTKIDGNVNRDAKHKAELEAMGWHVLVVWECELKSGEREETLAHLYETVVGQA